MEILIEPMGENGKNEKDGLGFFAVVDAEEQGFLGGLLVIDGFGRPLEFHCTAPVKPSRAHEILYGETLKPFLLGECIADAVLSKVKSPMSACVTESVDVFHGVKSPEMPWGLLTPNANTAPIIDLGSGVHTETLPFGGQCHLSSKNSEGWKTISDTLSACDLVNEFEPFARIRAALLEAQRASRPVASTREAA